MRRWRGPASVVSTKNGRSSTSTRGGGFGASARVRERIASIRSRRSSSAPFSEGPTCGGTAAAAGFGGEGNEIFPDSGRLSRESRAPRRDPADIVHHDTSEQLT